MSTTSTGAHTRNRHTMVNLIGQNCLQFNSQIAINFPLPTTATEQHLRTINRSIQFAIVHELLLLKSSTEQRRNKQNQQSARAPAQHSTFRANVFRCTGTGTTTARDRRAESNSFAGITCVLKDKTCLLPTDRPTTAELKKATKRPENYKLSGSTSRAAPGKLSMRSSLFISSPSSITSLKKPTRERFIKFAYKQRSFYASKFANNSQQCRTEAGNLGNVQKDFCGL